MFHHLVGLLTRQRGLPCRPHAYERCPERARRCPRCPLNGPSAAHFRARVTTPSRVRLHLRLLREQLRELDLGDALVLALLSLCLSLGACLGWLLASWAIR